MKKLMMLLAVLTAGQSFANSRTFVLVHGALFTSSGFQLLQNKLQIRGENVVTIDVPGRAYDGLDPKKIDLYTAVDKLCKVVKAISGDIVLVGHSQGGALITQALNDCGDSVKALVYLAAVVPLDGETAFQGLDEKRDVNFLKCVIVDAEAGLFRLNKRGPLEASFFADVRTTYPELADLALSTMVSEPMGIGTTKLKYDTEKFQSVPKYYVEALQDNVLTLETQRTYQKKIRFNGIYSVNSSHSPFLSRPDEVANILVRIAR